MSRVLEEVAQSSLSTLSLVLKDMKSRIENSEKIQYHWLVELDRVVNQISMVTCYDESDWRGFDQSPDKDRLIVVAVGGHIHPNALEFVKWEQLSEKLVPSGLEVKTDERYFICFDRGNNRLCTFGEPGLWAYQKGNKHSMGPDVSSRHWVSFSSACPSSRDRIILYDGVTIFPGVYRFHMVDRSVTTKGSPVVLCTDAETGCSSELFPLSTMWSELY